MCLLVRCVEAAWCLRLQRTAWPLKMKTPHSFETSGTTRPVTQRHIPADPEPSTALMSECLTNKDVSYNTGKAVCILVVQDRRFVYSNLLRWLAWDFLFWCHKSQKFGRSLSRAVGTLTLRPRQPHGRVIWKHFGVRCSNTFGGLTHGGLTDGLSWTDDGVAEMYRHKSWNIISFLARWGGCSTPLPVRLTPLKEPRCPLYRRLGPKISVTRCGEERISCCHGGSNSEPSIRLRIAIPTKLCRPQYNVTYFFRCAQLFIFIGSCF
jgi:hypothetical protein